MQCRLYSSDGPLMSEGTCEYAEDAIAMVASQWHMTPTVGGPPLTLVMQDGRQHVVRVDDVHVMASDAQTGPREVYRLVPLEEPQEERGGLLSGLKSLFGR